MGYIGLFLAHLRLVVVHLAAAKVGDDKVPLHDNVEEVLHRA